MTEAHGSHYVYLVLKKKLFLGPLSAIGHTPERQGLFLILMILMSLLGAGMGGYWVETGYINPPLQLFGICPPPGVLTSANPFTLGPVSVGGNYGCYIQQGTSSGGTIQVPYGHFEYLNGRNYTGVRP